MEIRCVAVIGAGTMGAGIAQICAQSGWRTNLFDAFPEGLERGMQRIDSFWDKGITRGKTTPSRLVAKPGMSLTRIVVLPITEPAAWAAAIVASLVES